MQTLTSVSVQKLVSRWEKDALESIAAVERSNHTAAEKRRQKNEIMEQFYQDRAEMEFAAIQTDLAVAKNVKNIEAEIEWVKMDMESEARCPEFMRSVFEAHLFECMMLIKSVKEEKLKEIIQWANP